MIRNTKKGRTPFKSKRHGKTRRVQRGGALVKDSKGNKIGEYDDTGQGRAVYPGVGVYVGHFNKNGVPHGEGKLTYDDESVYEGEWVNDMRYGRGVMTFAPSGDVYDGEWVNDVMSGHGIMTYKDIGVYTGKWENDEKNGLGTVKFIDGREYTGNWENDERNGQGTSRRSNGDVEYEGKWSENKKNGKGKMTYDNGDVYDGEWENDNRNGQGKMTYANGDKYEGEWDKDKKNGTGIYTYANGDKYEGEWDKDKKNGTGIYTFANGDVYDGELADNFMHGHGKMTFVNGDVYEGEWNANFMHGLGKMTSANGHVSEGPWFKDVKVDYNVSIARTTDEFMRMCLTAEKTQSECMDSECPICLNQFIFNGRLLRPVMFHETTNATGRKIWSCPVHTEEQLKYKHNYITSFSHTECINCRANLFLTKEQRDDVAATKMQRMIREQMGRRRRTRKKLIQANKIATFNAKFPPSRSISRPRSMSIPRAMSMPRTNRNNSDL